VLATDPVLLIEDNDGLRAALALMLEARGYKVVQARDGQEGWEYLERGGCPSVIVLDLLMPRLDGRLFRLKQLEREECASIPVVVFTATGEGLPDVVAVVRKANPESLLDIIDRAASVRALNE
jgi:chemotaxis family two-component system sensor histidine kinase/response regulator PixL